MNVFVSNRQRGVSIDLGAVMILAERAGRICGQQDRLADFAAPVLKEVAVSLVSDRRIAELHWQFLRVHGATDVITFAHGEIVVSAGTAQRAAADHGEPLERELCRYIVHGLLHLRGYDDSTSVVRATMWLVQEKIVRQLWPVARQPKTNLRKHVPRR